MKHFNVIYNITVSLYLYVTITVVLYYLQIPETIILHLFIYNVTGDMGQLTTRYKIQNYSH